MSLFKRFGEWAGDFAAGYNAKVRTRQAYDPQWFDKGLDLPPELMTAYRVREPYRENAAAHRVVRVVADVVSAIRFGLIPKGSEDFLPDDDALMLTFLQPNQRMSGRQLWARAVMDLYLYGNSVWLTDGIARLSSADASQFPRFLVPLPMARVKRDYDSQGRPVGFSIADRGGYKSIREEEVIHFQMENPSNPYWGLPEVASIQSDMDSYNLAWQTNLRLLRRGGPGLVVEQSLDSGGYISSEARERMEKDIDEGFSEDDEHSSLVLEPGMRLAKAGATQRDMDFDKLMRLARENIVGSLGSVPAVQGILEYANYANMGAQLEYLYLFTAFPMTVRLESAVQSQLLDRYGIKATAMFDRTSCRALYQNLQSLAQTAKSFYDMRVPFAAINDKLELGFDIDEYPWLFEDPGPAGLGLSTEPALPQSEDVRVRVAQEVTRSGRWLRIVSAADGAERRYLGFWRDHLAWLRDQVLSRLTARKQSFDATQSADDLMPSEHEITSHALRTVEPGARGAAVAGRRGIVAELQGKGGLSEWALSDPNVTKLVQARRVRVVGFSKEAAGRMRTAVTEGIEKGETVEQLADRVRAKHREEYVGQARVVARTETLASFSEARELSKVEAGVERHEWLTARDDRVRESHLIDGEVTKIGEEFSNGLRYPHDPQGDPEDVIQCRCVAAVVL